jgi:Gram-negative bacterial TonB protein C-terminal
MRFGKLFHAVALALLSGAPATAQPASPPGAPDITLEIGILRSERRFADEPDPQPEQIPHGIGYVAWHSWITPEDVPADLRARPYRTSTQLILDLDAQGRATRCRIVAPSTEPRLDALACSLLRRRGRFEPLYFGPGQPVAGKWLMAVTWRALTAEERAERGRTPSFSVGMPPPTSSLPEFTAWPRLAWSDHVRPVSLPSIQSDYPAAAGGREGTTSLELQLSAADGITGCTIGVSAGDPALDEAACRVARRIPLRYNDPCGRCFSEPLPLQVVWARQGSHIRFPLGRYRPRGPGETPVRDPADARTLVYQVRRPEPLPLLPRPEHSAGPIPNIGPIFTAAVTVDADGRVNDCRVIQPRLDASRGEAACRFLRERQRFAVPTDIFGNPLPGPHQGLFEIPPRF